MHFPLYASGWVMVTKVVLKAFPWLRNRNLSAFACNKGQPGASSSRFARGPGKGQTTWGLCTQPFPAIFLQEAISTT
jgi:hypothetical protein